jgi:hypothetical protein
MSGCDYCKTKKVGIIPFSCKCDFKILCAKCRLSSDHQCAFDYKKEWKDKLEKQLILVVGDKLNKI